MDYDSNIAGKDLQDPDHQMKDNASTFGGETSASSGSDSLFGFGGSSGDQKSPGAKTFSF